PSLMMVVPRGATARLVYAGRDRSDYAGLVLTVVTALVGLSRLARRPGPRPLVVPVVPTEEPPRRWGAVVPVAILAPLLSTRFLPAAVPDPALRERLYALASKAYAEDRFEDTAEYARSALELETSSSLRAELLCLRGESLLRADHPREAAAAF